MTLLKRTTAALLAVTMMTSACASAGRQVRTEPPRDPTLIAGYVKGLPIGSRVRARMVEGQTITGSLMKADDRVIVVQPHTRLPEPPVELALERVAAVELEQHSSGAGRTIGIAIAAGTGAALAFFLVLAAIYAGD